ncbi:MAG: putative signal transducing protein [Bacteroidota bacterium]
MNDTSKDWVRAYITNQPHRAEIVVAVLEDHDIEAHMIDKRDSSYLFGDIEVFVHPKDLEASSRLINENEL